MAISNDRIKTGTPHIMFVDDEEAARFLFSINFKDEIKNQEMVVSYACDGNDALDKIDEIKNELLVINSDINMPKKDGFELLEEVKRRYPDIIVFMISAYTSDDYIAKAKHLGADKYLTKPIDFKQLKEDLSNIINH